MTTTREIIEQRSPQADRAIRLAADEAAASLSILDGAIRDLDDRTALVRQHLAFEIEKVELAIERAEWEARADTSGPRERLRAMHDALAAISPEALRASRQPLAEIWKRLHDLVSGA
ncbi:hypothetical protein [Methylobacterium currus]|nr:hypothetical protein [Methylobacterium currus]